MLIMLYGSAMILVGAGGSREPITTKWGNRVSLLEHGRCFAVNDHPISNFLLGCNHHCQRPLIEWSCWRFICSCLWYYCSSSGAVKIMHLMIRMTGHFCGSNHIAPFRYRFYPDRRLY
jgi:hypothetical protein